MKEATAGENPKAPRLLPAEPGGDEPAVRQREQRGGVRLPLRAPRHRRLGRGTEGGLELLRCGADTVIYR